MKRLKLYILSAALACSVSVFAQKGPSFIGVSGGISMPTGNWGKSKLIISSTDFVNDPSGFAANGGLFAIDGAWFFSKHFGIGGMFNYATYSTKDLATLSLGYQQSFDVDSVNTTAGSYKVWNILPGLYFNYPLAKKLAVTARALAGITNATTPMVAVSVNDGGIYDGTFIQQPATKTSFAFQLGAGLNYKIIKCLAVDLRADYFYSKPDFTIQNTMRQNKAGRMVPEYNQPLTAVNISLGVSYLFLKK